MELKLKKIDWRLPPHELKANVDSNFTQLSFALKSLREELDAGASKLKCEDENLIVTEPKDLSLVYGLKLNPKLNVTSIKGQKAVLKEISSESLETTSIKAGLLTSNEEEVSIDGKLSYNKAYEAVTLGVKREFSTGPYQKTTLRMAPKKDTSAFHSLVIQSAVGGKKSAFQDVSTHMVVKGDGSVGIGVFHKLGAKLTLSGEGALLCLKDSTTPTAKNKFPIGTITWDEDFMYIKTKSGWKKTKLDIL